MFSAQYRKDRQLLIRALRSLLKAHLWESGYVNRRRAPLRLWVPKDAKGNLIQGRQFKLRDAFLLHSFDGFTEEGVIVDSFSGGMNSMTYEALPIEDLAKLHTWALRYFSKTDKPKASRKPAVKAA